MNKETLAQRTEQDERIAEQREAGFTLNAYEDCLAHYHSQAKAKAYISERALSLEQLGVRGDVRNLLQDEIYLLTLIEWLNRKIHLLMYRRDLFSAYSFVKRSRKISSEIAQHKRAMAQMRRNYASVLEALASFPVSVLEEIDETDRAEITAHAKVRARSFISRANEEDSAPLVVYGRTLTWLLVKLSAERREMPPQEGERVCISHLCASPIAAATIAYWPFTTPLLEGLKIRARISQAREKINKIIKLPDALRSLSLPTNLALSRNDPTVKPNAPAYNL